MQFIKTLYWKIFYGLSFLLFIISFALEGMRYIFLSETVFIICLVSSMAAFIFWVFSADYGSAFFHELMIVYAILSLFFIVAYISPYSNKEHFRVILVEMSAICLPAFYMIIQIIKDIQVDKLFNWFGRNKFNLIICSIFLIASIETLDDWTKLDSGTYYAYVSAAKSFDFTFETFELFKLGGHRSYGAAFFYLIGEYIFPQNPAGVRIVQIVCLCITLFMFSSLLRYLRLDRNKNLYNALLCGLFAFCPLILGTIYSINVDFMMMCFWVWTIYFLINNRTLLFICSSLFLIFSKETGIVIYCGILFGWLLGVIKNNKHSFFLYIKNNWIRFVLFCVPIVTFLVSWLFGGTIWFASKNPLSLSNSNDSFHKFGVSLISIISKVKELYILNFNWLLLLIIIIAILLIGINFAKRHKLKTVNTNTNWQGHSIIFFSYVFFLLFNFGYITYGLPRYVMPSQFVYIVLVAISLKYCNLKNIYSLLLVSLLNVLMFFQCFYTIDPVTLSVFRNINIGRHKIISTIDYTMYNNEVTTDPEILSERVFSHSMEYNREYTAFGEAFETFLKKIKYNNDTMILIESIYGNESIDFSSIVMFGKEGGNSASYYYDTKSGNFKSDSQYPTLKLKFINRDSTEEIDTALNEFSKVYVVSFPYNDNYTEFSTVEKYNYNNEFSVYNRGWEINVRELTK